MALAAARTGKPATGSPDCIRVMVVDDSAVVRGLLVRTLEQDAAIQVVSSVSNGVMALKAQKQHTPDVVVLDIEMPVMDGMTALPKLLEADPTVKVIMASTLTMHNAKISLEALAKGASDYIPKPGSGIHLSTAEEFKRSLIEKIKALSKKPSPAAKTESRRAQSGAVSHKVSGDISLRPFGKTRPEVLAIGSSTGGPQALLKLFGSLKSSVELPIFITQHMPPNFTTILAQHLANATGLVSGEGKDGEDVQPGHIYVAPGDYHMRVARSGAKVVVRLDQKPAVNFCRPAVDPMLDSLVAVYGPAVLAVILTGMGHDGRDGCQTVVRAGGSVIAQDEESSVVWGMPGAAAAAGVCSAVLPIDAIPAEIGNTIRGPK